jgi:hypothetical protein
MQCEPVACGRYKLVDNMVVDDVDNLYVKRIVLNNL